MAQDVTHGDVDLEAEEETAEGDEDDDAAHDDESAPARGKRKTVPTWAEAIAALDLNPPEPRVARRGRSESRGRRR